jgi:hypothetical protein
MVSECSAIEHVTGIIQTSVAGRNAEAGAVQIQRCVSMTCDLHGPCLNGSVCRSSVC